MLPDPDASAPSARPVLRATYAALFILGTAALAIAIAEMSKGSDGPLAYFALALATLLPYTLAAGVSWLARRKPSLVRPLLAFWVVGGLASIVAAVNAIWLNPRFLSGILILILPAYQTLAVVVAGVVVKRLSRRPPPRARRPRLL